MIFILVLAAAAQAAVPVPPVRVLRPVPQSPPVVPVVTVPPANTAVAPAGELAVHLMPDLVVKAIRVAEEGVYVQVANEGTAPARAFQVDAAVSIGPRRAFSFSPGTIDGLAVGESKWAMASIFSPIGEASYPPPPPFELPKATGIRASADPQKAKAGGGWGSGWDPVPDPTAKKDPCTDPSGCIKELHEDNNSMIVEGDAIVRGKPD